MTSTLTTHTTTLNTLSSKKILSYQGAWESGTYSYLDAVTLNGSLYACVNSEGTSSTPGDGDDWEETVAAGADGTNGSDGKDGADGADGADGKDGADGADGTSTYIHVAYSTAFDGSENFSTTDSTDATYIGILTDSNESASTNYADYTWTQIRGADGTNGTDGASSLTIFFSPTHHNLTVDEEGNLNETLGLGGSTDSLLYAFVGTEQAAVTGIDITSRTNCSVSTKYDSSVATLALSAVTTAAKAISGNTATLPVSCGSYTFIATIVYGSTIYTTEPITVSFSVDYSAWHESLLSVTVGNISETVAAVESALGTFQALTSAVTTISTELVKIGAAAGVDGYDDGTDSITTSAVPLLEDVEEVTAAIVSDVSSLKEAVAAVTEATALTKYTFSESTGLMASTTTS